MRYTVVRAVREGLAHLKEHGSSIGFKDRLATVDEYFSAVDLERYLEMEQEIMRPYASSGSSPGRDL